MRAMEITLTTGREAAELFGVTSSRIRQIAIAAGIERKGRDWIFNAEELKIVEAGTRKGQNMEKSTEASQPSEAETLDKGKPARKRKEA